MTETSLQRVTANYEALAGHIRKLTRSFYDRLFEAMPHVRALFRLDIDLQSQHLAAALALIVRNLRDLDLLEEPLMELGAGHARVGVRPEHYPVLCRTMVQTLRDGSGGTWSPELDADWTELLARVSRIMMAGATRHAASSRRPRLP